MHDMKSNLSNRIIQIAGSSSKKTDVQIIEFSHQLIRSVTKKLLDDGAIIVSIVGKEKEATIKPADIANPSIIFYWDIFETVYEYAKSMSFSNNTKNLVKVVSSEKAEAQIPENRKEMWNQLISKGIISLHRINPGWNAGAYKRQKQEELSDVLLILGGGEGVEHLASLYVSHGKPVLPLDIPLGSSYGDGLGGSSLLSRLSIVNPKRFIPRISEETASKLAYLSYERWKTDPEKYAYCILDFLETVVKPQVFYVRLLNKDEKEYQLVESFFRNVVDPVVQKLQYSIKDMGVSDVKSAFLNIEIFHELHNSSIVIADITGLRPNCFIEAGYAFGLNKKVILTAQKGTKLPFDPSAIPCYFWDPDISGNDKQESFLEFWKRNINRPPLISNNEII